VVAQLVEKVVTFVVDGSAEPETVDKHAAFLGTAGDSDHVRALGLRDLTGDASDGSGRSRYEHHVACG
jgi:hypothetical protein